MKVIAMQRVVDKLKAELCHYDTNKSTEEPSGEPPVKQKRKGRSGPEDWVLRGAARPAALIARIESGELDETGVAYHIPNYINLFEREKGRLWAHPDTREYLQSLYGLGEACIVANLTTAGIRHFQSCLDLDAHDHVRARESLVNALMDEGRAGEARAIMDSCLGESNNNNNNNNTVFAYARAMTEYVAWFIRREADASEDIAAAALQHALSLNPFIAVFICGYEVFAQVVEYVDEIQTSLPGSIEEAYVYCSRNVGMWLDTEGVQDWIAQECSKCDEPVVDASVYSDEMYASMYHTAMDMIQQEAEEGEEEDRMNRLIDEDGDDEDEDEEDSTVEY